MTAKTRLADSLTKLLGASSRPIYAVDVRRQILYCNAALANWLGMDPRRIIGREVEYHSEPEENGSSSANEVGPLAALCPPPRAMSGEPCDGTVSCVAPDGRLVHRQAEFIPLASAGGGVLVLLSSADISPQELAAELADESTADELHRAIRVFRRAQATHYGVPSLLGDSPAIRKVRAQVAAAAASGANVLVIGTCGSGRAHVARVIHYRAAADTNLKLVPVDCGMLTDDLLRRTLDSLHGPPPDGRLRPTLLLENLDRMSPPHQSQFVAAVRKKENAARIIATLYRTHIPYAVADPWKSADQPDSQCSEPADGTQKMPATADQQSATIQPELLDMVSTITIRQPRLVDRLEDLPLLAQALLESCNQRTSKQVGEISPEALDSLALYRWPGELDELRDVIAAAHRATATHKISPRDLPAVIHHANRAAAMPRRQPERIVLDELLANIEKEVIERALAQAGGNKTEAATLLGMTRPRLYRRLVQLGLAGAVPGEVELEGPEFVERNTGEQEL